MTDTLAPAAGPLRRRARARRGPSAQLPTTPAPGLGGAGRGPGGRRPGFRALLQGREYRALFGADVVSLVGDQVAAVGLAVLLYQRTGSALLSALGYACAYLPWTLGGPLLSVFADRLPTRRVMVGCDLARAAAIGLAALPGMPVLAVALLVLAAALLAPPFDSANASLLPQVLTDDRYVVAVSIRSSVHQVAQVGGFVGGGALVALVSPNGALALDAVSFALSAVMLRAGLLARPAAACGPGRLHLLADALEGWRAVRADRRLYRPLLLGMSGAGYAIVPEAIAPAYARSLGQPAAAVGLVMAAVAFGSVVGSLGLARVRPAVRGRMMWPMALAGTVPLLAVALRPGLAVSLVLFAAAGTATSFQVQASTAFAAAVPEMTRGRVFGIAMTGMFGGQAVAILLAGAAAQVLPPTAVIAGAAGLGGLAVLALRPSVPVRGRRVLPAACRMRIGEAA